MGCRLLTALSITKGVRKLAKSTVSTASSTGTLPLERTGMTSGRDVPIVRGNGTEIARISASGDRAAKTHAAEAMTGSMLSRLQALNVLLPLIVGSIR